MGYWRKGFYGILRLVLFGFEWGSGWSRGKAAVGMGGGGEAPQEVRANPAGGGGL